MFFGIDFSDEWESVTSISKGWSSDKKYLVVTRAGEKLLLRISDIEQYEAKQKEYDIICRYSRCDLEMSRPLAFGLCNNGENVYILLSWVEGIDLEEILPKLSMRAQYLLGRQAGGILKKIHSVKLEPEEFPQQTKREKKLLQLSRYENSNLRISGDQTAVDFVKNNMDKIWRMPPSYLHGDFHPGNLIYMDNGTIGVIDFNRWEIGDPYEEFYKLQSFGTELSIPYCIGEIDAYFNDRVPEEFWIANAVYVAHASLFSIKWAEKFGQQDVDGMIKRARAAFEDFEDFNQIIPKWYAKKNTYE